MALIRGVGSLVPCPRCLIPEDKLGDHSAKAPLRTTADMKAIILEAQEQHTVNEGEEILKAAGLRDVDVRLRSCYPLYVLLLRILDRMYSGGSTTQTHTRRCLLIASILSPAACFGTTCGTHSRNLWRRWVGIHVLRLIRCTYRFLYLIIIYS